MRLCAWSRSVPLQDKSVQPPVCVRRRDTIVPQFFLRALPHAVAAEICWAALRETRD